ncbi:hypothetical protein [Paenibacillus sp. yr247]|uniref:hypothetical protein n=1 Tax=Paenibacillus sp. yr247 TaxID=1761880 RepID=UPI000AC2B7D0|nr:hypothetical protein [Paenibacillus sp. yr247]
MIPFTDLERSVIGEIRWHFFCLFSQLVLLVDKTPSWIHIVTAVYGLVVGWMLYREEQKVL